MTYPKVSIIILNWNGLEDTIECLESLKKITYPDYEIVVVDNASSGGDVEVLRQRFGDYIHIIENDRNYGFAEGNNIGIRHALGSACDYVLLLNNDTVVAPDFLDELTKVVEGDSTVGIAGPKMYYMDRPDVLWFAGGKEAWLTGASHRGERQRDKGQFDRITDTRFVSGACMLIKRQTIHTIGLLPTEYFLGREDVDYCTNALRNGFRCIYVPKAKIWHKAGTSFGRANINSVRVMDGIRNRFIFARKYFSAPRFSVFVVYFTLIVVPGRIVYCLIYYHDWQSVAKFLKSMRHTKSAHHDLYRT